MLTFRSEPPERRPVPMTAPLQIEWAGKPYADSNTAAVAVQDPQLLMTRLAPGAEWKGPEGYMPTFEEFFLEMQRYLREAVNRQLRQVEPFLQSLQERAAAQERTMEQAYDYIQSQVAFLESQVLDLASRENPAPMDWQPTATIESIDLQKEVDRRVAEGIYHYLSHSTPSVAPPVPPSTIRRKPSGRSIRQYAPEHRSRSITPLSRVRPTRPAVTAPLAPPEVLETPTPQPRVPPPPGQAASAPAPQQAAPAVHQQAAQGQGEPGVGRGAEGGGGGGGDDDDGDDSSEGDPVGGAGGGGGRGRGGGRGGRGGGRGGRGDGGPEYPDDDSDSDPEPDPGRYPRRWQSWVKRGAERRAFNDAAQFFRGMMPQQLVPQQRDCKVPDPECFKGDPEDLDRFLLQVENKFDMEPFRFSTDVIKIRYAGQLLKDKAYRWYRAYHLQISSKDAYRVRGSRELDPQFASWDRFEASLRSSFGERVTRAQAVRTWDRLKHKESIDDFIDELSRLMWLTGYEGEVVEDKIREGLNDMMALEWAKVARKPYEIGDQLSLLRDMGHAIEDATRHRKPKGNQQQQQGDKGQQQPQDGKGKGSNPKGKGKGGQQGAGKPQKTREWKDEATELKGIPKDILEERRQAKKCTKCGKPNHKWVDCYTKAPVTTRTIAGSKRSSDGSDSGKGSKKAKTAGAQAQAEAPAAAASGRVIEIPDAIGEDFDVWALP